MTKFRGLKTILWLIGSFTFAFLLGELIHEGGHYLAHTYFRVPGIAVHLDPFGGSRILGVKTLPLREMGITTAAGPGLNLAAGMLASLLLWRCSRFIFLPLVLWGPVALIQEGVNLSLGLLSPGSDAQWLVQWGIPAVFLSLIGVLFILVGTGLISSLLHRYVLKPERPFLERFGIVFLGMGFLMILRAAVSSFISPAAALENLIPLVFSLLLASMISAMQPVWQKLNKSDPPHPPVLSWSASFSALGLGLGILLVQIIFP